MSGASQTSLSANSANDVDEENEIESDNRKTVVARVCVVLRGKNLYRLFQIQTRLADIKRFALFFG